MLTVNTILSASQFSNAVFFFQFFEFFYLTRHFLYDFFFVILSVIWGGGIDEIDEIDGIEGIDGLHIDIQHSTSDINPVQLLQLQLKSGCHQQYRLQRQVFH
jgi:hypothetical protein